MGNICVWIHEARVGATEEQVGVTGKSKPLNSISVAAAVFARLCNSQIMPSLK